MREVSFVATRRCGAPYRRLLYFFCYFAAPTRASHIISSYWVIGWKHSRDVESEIFWYFFSMFRFICHEKSFLLFLRQRLAFFWVLLSRARRWHFLCLISKPSSKKKQRILIWPFAFHLRAKAVLEALMKPFRRRVQTFTCTRALSARAFHCCSCFVRAKT